MNRDFEVFKKEFEKYRKILGLGGYKCFYKCEPIEGAYANITIDEDCKAATVRLNSVCSREDKPFYSPREHAKHEALHLLIGRLETLANDRWGRSCEISEECESIVVKLEELIP